MKEGGAHEKGRNHCDYWGKKKNPSGWRLMMKANFSRSSDIHVDTLIFRGCALTN